MRLTLRDLIATVLICAVCVSCYEPPVTYTYSSFLETFDPEAPGTGVETTGESGVKQPMACALIARAAALAGDKPTTITAADCLLQTRNTGNGVGWGLGWEWDAFGDGSLNPATTVYGITTALAVEGLIGAHELTKNVRYKDAAIAALNYYSSFISKNKSGSFFWYSDQAPDEKNVYNVNSMVAGAFALAAERFDIVRFQNIAGEAIKSVTAGAIKGDDGLTWRYSDLPDSRFNDLVHAAYIAYGIARVQRVTGAKFVDRSNLVKYIAGFASDSGVFEFRPSETSRKDARARGWGLGMGAYVLTVLGERALAKQYLSHLKDYEFAPNQFSYIFGDQLNVPRSNAHILLALSAFEHEN